MNIIATVDKNWGIGVDQKLLVNIPADQRFIREVTQGKVIIMGRRAYEALSTTTMTEKRTIYVLSKNPKYIVKGAEVVRTKEEVMDKIAGCPTEDVFIIGGASIYEQFIEYCDCAHITKIDFNYHANMFHPNLDESPDWELVGISDEQTYYDLEYTFCKYTRK